MVIRQEEFPVSLRKTLTSSDIKNPTAFNVIVGFIVSIAMGLIKFEMKYQVIREVAAPL